MGALGANNSVVKSLVEKQMNSRILGAALHVRGGASVCATSSAFVDNKTAVDVDFNFDGDVVLRGCAFGHNTSDVCESLSGPVLRDTARPSQRYPFLLRAMGFLVLDGPIRANRFRVPNEPLLFANRRFEGG